MLERPVSSAVFAQWACGLFPALRDNDPATSLAAYVQAAENGTPARVAIKADWRWPRCAIIFCGSHTLVVINSTESLVQATNLFLGYTVPIRGRSLNVINQQMTSAAAFYLPTEDDLAGWQNDAIIVGHSQGGAIAPILASELRNLSPRLRPRCLTFGAPKCVSTRQVLEDNNRFPIVRYMNVGDPIPSFPYVAETNLAAQLMVPSATANASMFSQHWGGRRLDVDGTMRSYSSQPSDQLVPNLPDFAAWLYNTELGNDTAHSIGAYQQRLTVYNANNPEGAGVIIPSVRPDPPLAVPRAEAVRASELVTTTVFAAGALQQRPRLVQPPKTAFYAVKKGRIWSVWLGNTQVALGPTKKRARGMARVGNALLARMQRSAFVDPVTMTAGIGAVISEMADPSGPFRPPLRVEMPVVPPFRLRGR